MVDLIYAQKNEIWKVFVWPLELLLLGILREEKVRKRQLKNKTNNLEHGRMTAVESISSNGTRGDSGDWRWRGTNCWTKPRGSISKETWMKTSDNSKPFSSLGQSRTPDCWRNSRKFRPWSPAHGFKSVKHSKTMSEASERHCNRIPNYCSLGWKLQNLTDSENVNLLLVLVSTMGMANCL